MLGTSSSETALPGMMQKLRRLGCAELHRRPRHPHRLQLQSRRHQHLYAPWPPSSSRRPPTRRSTLGQQISLLLDRHAYLKGASGVTGAGFVTLAATLAVVPTVPIESLALLVGIDRFMSECRALTNLIGNGVATLVVSRWEKEITPEQLRAAMHHPHSLTEIAHRPADGI